MDNLHGKSVVIGSLIGISGFGSLVVGSTWIYRGIFLRRRVGANVGPANANANVDANAAADVELPGIGMVPIATNIVSILGTVLISGVDLDGWSVIVGIGCGTLIGVIGYGLGFSLCWIAYRVDHSNNEMNAPLMEEIRQMNQILRNIREDVRVLPQMRIGIDTLVQRFNSLPMAAGVVGHNAGPIAANVVAQANPIGIGRGRSRGRGSEPPRGNLLPRGGGRGG